MQKVRDLILKSLEGQGMKYKRIKTTNVLYLFQDLQDAKLLRL